MIGAFNLATHLLEARLAEGAGARPALLTPERTYSYADVAREADAVARGLRAAGVGRGDRVLFALPDGFAFAATFFGTLKIGAIGAMANPDVPVEDHAYLLAYTGARAFVTSVAVAARIGATLAARFPAVRLFVADAGADDPRAFPPASDVAEPTEPTSGEDVALWLFTSGATGQPKAAIHRHQDFAFHIDRYAKGILGLRPDDVTLAVPRLYFPYATGMNLMFPFAVGARAVLFPEHPTPARLFELIARFRPTIFTTVPTMTAKMLAEPDAERQDLSSLRLAVTAGEALPPELYARWKRTFGVEMLDGIGSAEMFHIYISNRPGDVRPGSLGRLVPGYEARVVRPDGSDAPPDETGTLWVRGGSMLLGYHDDAEKTRAVLRDGWVVSGDMFRRDPEGHFFYEGRADDMLKVGGIYVSPLEVENVIASHPAVAECAVVGFEDEHGLVKPRAYVVTRPGQVATDSLFATLAAHARERLAHYKVPRSWVASSGLPRNDRGKVMRRLLRS